MSEAEDTVSTYSRVERVLQKWFNYTKPKWDDSARHSEQNLLNHFGKADFISKYKCRRTKVIVKIGWWSQFSPFRHSTKNIYY